ncbi:nicotinate (nicotinamide) nucleotide adenylyltransferase [Aquabacterium sp.]|uniref:nicotinate (nicotinamide) nucleotide adenylyltransferase n=1 Tax=Aquabacterium sp. TaxID=1872578 RepID=UPI003D6D9802
MPPTAGRKIGLFGGSFDPVHQAHLALAQTALSHLHLDEIRWIPVGQPWQKARQLASAEHRLAMVRAATEHEPRFVVDPLETARGGPSYTLDTVRALQSGESLLDATLVERWFLIIGQDQYANLHTWHGWQELLRRVTLAVASRAGQAPRPDPELASHPHRMVVLPMPDMLVSSTDIRARLAQNLAQKDAAQTLAPAMVPNAVARYIEQHQLYAAGTPR